MGDVFCLCLTVSRTCSRTCFVSFLSLMSQGTDWLQMAAKSKFYQVLGEPLHFWWSWYVLWHQRSPQMMFCRWKAAWQRSMTHLWSADPVMQGGKHWQQHPLNYHKLSWKWMVESGTPSSHVIHFHDYFRACR